MRRLGRWVTAGAGFFLDWDFLESFCIRWLGVATVDQPTAGVKVLGEMDLAAAHRLARRLSELGVAGAEGGLWLVVRRGRRLSVRPSWQSAWAARGLLRWIRLATNLPLRFWPALAVGPGLVVEAPAAGDGHWVERLAGAVFLWWVWQTGRLDRLTRLSANDVADAPEQAQAPPPQRAKEDDAMVKTPQTGVANGKAAQVTPKVLSVTVARQGIAKPGRQRPQPVMPPPAPRPPGG